MFMKFKGANGSLGLEHGAVYDVIFDAEYKKTHPKSKFNFMATITDSEKKSVNCAYGSEKAFLGNFEAVPMTDLATVKIGKIANAK